MSEGSFRWSEYNLSGPPALSLGDYTFKAYGSNEVLQKVEDTLRGMLERGLGVKWKLVGYWGVGKSTFAYNLCYRLNRSLFFEDGLEKPDRHEYTHLLSFYVNVPRKRPELLEHTFEEGLPIPWEPDKARVTIKNDRMIMLYECLRKLTFLLLRKALQDPHFLHQVRESNKNVFKTLSHVIGTEDLKTKELIDQIDIIGQQNEFYAELGRFLRYYLTEKIKMPYRIADHLPDLLYPIHSSSFLGSLRKLAGYPGYYLRDFNFFEIICTQTNTHLLLVIDECENWRSVVKQGLDRELLSMAENDFPSIILIFRTLFPKSVRRGEVFGRYLALWEQLEYMNIPEPNVDQIIEITKGILLTSKLQMNKTLFPLTEDFAVALAQKTKRGRRFNVRLYIRALMEILEKSLTWERPTVELNKELLDLEWVRDTITDVLVSEMLKERETVYVTNKAFLRSIAAAEIAEHILNKGCPDKTRLEGLKFSVAKKYNAPVPSNIEIIASVDELAYRRRLQHIIESIT